MSFRSMLTQDTSAVYEPSDVNFYTEKIDVMEENSLSEHSNLSEDKNANGRINLTELSSKLILRIFRYVPMDASTISVMLTCKLFYTICQTKYFWRRRYLWVTTLINDGILEKFVRIHGDSIKWLLAKNNRYFRDRHLLLIMKYCNSLTHVDVSGTRVTSFSLKELAHLRTGQLKSLKIAHCANIDCATLLIIAEKHGKSLVELDIEECCDIYSRAALFHSSAKLIHNLKALRMGQVVNTHHATAVQDSDILPFMRTSGSSGMERLELCHCTINDNTLKMITVRWTDITTLNLSYSFVSDSIVRHICTTLVKLRWLDLSHCLSLTDTGLGRLDKISHTLYHLNLSGCIELAKYGLPFFATMVRLRELILCGIYRLNDAGINKITHHCSKIGYLDITNTNVSQDAIDTICYTARRYKLFIYHGRHPKIQVSSSKRIAC